MIDRVRDWGNIFTGNTGYSIARALTDAGDVDLLTSNPAHLEELRRAPGRITPHPFSSHATLHAALATMIRGHRYDGVFMTAAVSDYAPAGVYEVVERRPADDGGEVWRVRNVTAGKVKSTFESLAVLGTRTRKLVDLFRTEWGYRGLLVKFKLEVGVGRDDLVRIGQSSRIASGADYLVANTLDMVGGPEAGAYLLGETVEEWVPREQLPARLARLARDRVPGGPP
jgi:phosphopantothenoylcysteine synthetase/decarboxylase